MIKVVADASPHKQGRFLPGSHIPVVSPEKIKELKPDYFDNLPMESERGDYATKCIYQDMGRKVCNSNSRFGDSIMKILITGSTGFIGRHVVQWLVDHGYDDIIATGTSIENAKQFSWFSNVNFIPCDYFAEDINYYEFFDCPDLLIHLAWKGLPNYMALFHMEENLPIEMRFLRSFAHQRRQNRSHRDL